MQFVYILWHTHELENGEQDSKLLGVYSSESLAMSKISEYKRLPGFSEHSTGFEVGEYQVDTDHWKEGFISCTG